jgi:predicted transcriptional regulator
MPHSVRNQQKPWTPSDVAELRAFVDEEMSLREIARELGRTVAAVRAKAAQEDIPLTSAAAMKADVDEDE